MSEKKNFPNKENNENQSRIEKELDGDRLKNNIKKFSFILEDKKTIKKPSVASPINTVEREKKETSKNNIITSNTKSFNEMKSLATEKNKSSKDIKSQGTEKDKSKSKHL